MLDMLLFYYNHNHQKIYINDSTDKMYQLCSLASSQPYLEF